MPFPSLSEVLARLNEQTKQSDSLLQARPVNRIDYRNDVHIHAQGEPGRAVALYCVSPSCER